MEMRPPEDTSPRRFIAVRRYGSVKDPRGARARASAAGSSDSRRLASKRAAQPETSPAPISARASRACATAWVPPSAGTMSTW